jgi:hypothetical protein
MKALRISTIGTRQPVTITGETIAEQNKCIRNFLGGFFEPVTISPGAVMLVNEEGLIKRLAYNSVASIIAAQDIVGPALIVGVRELDGGELAFCDCPREYLEGKIC